MQDLDRGKAASETEKELKEKLGSCLLGVELPEPHRFAEWPHLEHSLVCASLEWSVRAARGEPEGIYVEWRLADSDDPHVLLLPRSLHRGGHVVLRGFGGAIAIPLSEERERLIIHSFPKWIRMVEEDAREFIREASEDFIARQDGIVDPKAIKGIIRAGQT